MFTFGKDMLPTHKVTAKSSRFVDIIKKMSTFVEENPTQMVTGHFETAQDALQQMAHQYPRCYTTRSGTSPTPSMNTTTLLRTGRSRSGSDSSTGNKKTGSAPPSPPRNADQDAPSMRDYDEDEDDEEEEYEECEPAYIHWLRNGDTISKVSKIYRIPANMICKANDISNPDSNLDGKRFLVVPSPSTFQEPIWDVYQEQHELCKNFLLIVRQFDYGLAHTYLGRTNYNLPRAIENYYYDLC